MAAGLQRQLARCTPPSTPPAVDAILPVFCADDAVHVNVINAYNHLWDLIEANAQYLSFELWSWTYDRSAGFEFVELGALPPPEGSSQTESNIRQLWSLTFLAVGRDESLRA